MATLNISDLSVGDWVRVINQFDAQIDGYHSESGSLSLKTRQIHLVHYRLEDIHPIPITLEILEANGFEDNGVGQHYLKCGNGITVRVGHNPLSHDGCWLVATDKQVDETISTTCVLFDARHIHQLQHALRLAGVDKEIVMPNK